jgi:glucokinase
VVEAVAVAVSEVDDGGPIGVGMPGFIRDGVVHGSPNFPGWSDVDLRAALARRLDRQVCVANDANVAALGAWASRGGTEDLVMLTLGTGVGGGVVMGGRLLTGALGTGAELGHIHVGGNRPCGCGGLGCLETWCGTVGLVAAAAERGVAASDGAAVRTAAERGEAWAIEVLSDAAEHLGKGLVTLVNIFNPDVVIIAGGLTAARYWFEPAEAWLLRYGVPPSAEHVEVVWGGRADIWAIVGAGALAST